LEVSTIEPPFVVLGTVIVLFGLLVFSLGICLKSAVGAIFATGYSAILMFAAVNQRR
jgi:hypothetical protein